MGFWIFMLIVDLLIPLTMLGFGRYFIKNTPKKINNIFGYRTTMSMKNIDTWNFAQAYFGRVWYICGIATLIISIIFMVLVLGKSQDTVGIAGAVLCGLQTLPLIGAIFPTEKALKKAFDFNGNPRN